MMRPVMEQLKKAACRGLGLMLALVLLVGIAAPAMAAETENTGLVPDQEPAAVEEPTEDGDASGSDGGTSDESGAPACDCGTEGDIGIHADACALKTYYRELYANTSAADLAAMWSKLPADAQSYILDSISWNDQTKRAELAALLETEEEPSGTETVVGEITFTSEAKISVEGATAEKQTALTEAPFLQELEEGDGYAAYDIDGSEAAAITISGLLDSGDYDVTVYHLLDTPSAITGDLDYFVVSDENAALFAAEIAAARDAIQGLTENRVYYTVLQIAPYEDGDITFTADSFSMFVVTWKDGAPYDSLPTADALLYLHYITMENWHEFVPVSGMDTVLTVTYRNDAWSEFESGETWFKVPEFAAQTARYGTLAYAYVLNLVDVNNYGKAVFVEKVANYNGQWCVYTSIDSFYPTSYDYYQASDSLDLYLVYSNSFVDTVSSAGTGIVFNLFDYGSGLGQSTNGTPVDNYDINKVNGALRPLAPYFRFSATATTSIIPQALDTYGYSYDAGFSEYHATLERSLSADGFPVYSQFNTHSWDNARYPDLTSGKLLSQKDRSLAFLFDPKTTDPAVRYYPVTNTLLQYNANTGMYWYDSWSNAVDYDTNTKQFFVRNYTEKSLNTSWINHEGYQAADFFPLNSTGGYAGLDKNVGSVFDSSMWDPNKYVTPKHDAVCVYQYGANEFNYGFGMTMQAEFLQSPEGINKISGGDQVFHFSGDDDVWVFIDGILVLDLGGTHSRVSGSINFRTGEVSEQTDCSTYYIQTSGWYSYASTIYERFRRGYLGQGMTAQQAQEKLDQTFVKIDKDENGNTLPTPIYRFRNYSSHTLSFYYLERGSYASTCSIYFNLETVPTNSLSFGKEVVGGNVDPDELYDFVVSLTDKDSSTNAPVTGVVGQIYSEGASTTTEIRDENDGNRDGVYHFRMKAGETAMFPNLDAWTAYVVLENSPDKYTVSWLDENGVEQGGANGVSGVLVDQKVVFRCINTLRIADLTISKLYSNTVPTPDPDPDQTFIFHVTGVPNTDTAGFSMDVAVRGNDFVTIKDLFVGDYVVTEDSGWSWRYTVAEGGVTAVNGNGETVRVNSSGEGHRVTLSNTSLTVTVKNDRPEDRWMDGNSYCQNLFTGSGVTKKENENEANT